MIDPDLGNNYSSRELQKVLAVARLCIKTRYEPPSFSITHVYRYLQKKIDVATWILVFFLWIELGLMVEIEMTCGLSSLFSLLPIFTPF